MLNIDEKLDERQWDHGHAYVSDNVEAYAGRADIRLVGRRHSDRIGGNDTLVFANKIGTDVVHDLDASHDKIDLIGFNGFSSFADVQAHLTSDRAGNAMIALADDRAR